MATGFGVFKEHEIEMFAWPLTREGGQHVGRTSASVLIVHLATGISVIETGQRSQFQNRETALIRLAELVAFAGAGNPETPMVERVQAVQPGCQHEWVDYFNNGRLLCRRCSVFRGSHYGTRQ